MTSALCGEIMEEMLPSREAITDSLAAKQESYDLTVK